MTIVRPMLMACLMFASVSTASPAEQITSACRVTAVDPANRTVTLVRKTASGGKIGQCKLAESINIEINGKSTQWDAVKLPCEATVIYDTALRAAVAIHLWDNGRRDPLGMDAAPATYDATASSSLFVLANTFTGHARDNKVFGVAFSPDGTTLASCSGDRTVRLWNLAKSAESQSHRMLGEPRQPWAAFGVAISYTPDGKTLIMGRLDGTIELWNMSANPPAIRRILEPFTSAACRLSVSPDGRLLAVGEQTTGSVRVWDLTKEDLSEIASLEHDGKACAAVSFSPDSKVLAVGLTRQVCLHDMSAGKPWGRRAYDIVSDAGARAICFSPDGETMTFGDGRLLRVLGVDGFSPIATLDANEWIVATSALSRDGRFLFTAGYDSRLRMWDMRTFSEVADTGRLQGIGEGMAISPDGKHMATGGIGGFVRLWTIPELQP